MRNKYTRETGGICLVYLPALVATCVMSPGTSLESGQSEPVVGLQTLSHRRTVHYHSARAPCTHLCACVCRVRRVVSRRVTCECVCDAGELFLDVGGWLQTGAGSLSAASLLLSAAAQRTTTSRAMTSAKEEHDRTNLRQKERILGGCKEENNGMIRLTRMLTEINDGSSFVLKCSITTAEW